MTVLDPQTTNQENVYTAPLTAKLTTMGRQDEADDPRKLRPGEIDPNPECKPARPDPVRRARARTAGAPSRNRAARSRARLRRRLRAGRRRDTPTINSHGDVPESCQAPMYQLTRIYASMVPISRASTRSDVPEVCRGSSAALGASPPQPLAAAPSATRRSALAGGVGTPLGGGAGPLGPCVPLCAVPRRQAPRRSLPPSELASVGASLRRS